MTTGIPAGMPSASLSAAQRFPITLPHGHMPTTPSFVVSNKTSGTFKVTCGSDTYDLVVGSNKIPSIMVGGDEDVTLTFTGSAKVEIVYRSGSL